MTSQKKLEKFECDLLFRLNEQFSFSLGVTHEVEDFLGMHNALGSSPNTALHEPSMIAHSCHPNT